MIKILIADDQSLFREGLNTLLSVQPDFQIIGEAGNGEEAVKLALLHRPDIILMDLRMPVLDGVSSTRRIMGSLPDIKVIVLTTFDEDKDIFEALRAGAIGYLLKDVSSDKLFEAIRAAHRGEYFLHPTITAKVVAEYSKITHIDGENADIENPLSVREIEILKLIAAGMSNKEIADHLVIAEGTVKNHVSNILSKLGGKDRMQAVLKAKEMGILKR